MSRIAPTTILTLTLFAGSSAGFAAEPTGTDHGQTVPRAAAPFAPVGIAFGPVQKVLVKTESTLLSTTSATFVNVPGAVVSDVVPGTGFVAYHVTFSARCAIDGDGAEEDVVVRVLINGVAMPPGATTFCEDSTDNLAIPEGANAQQWAVKNQPAGATNNIRVQWRTDTGATGFLGPFNLTVRRHQNN